MSIHDDDQNGTQPPLDLEAWIDKYRVGSEPAEPPPALCLDHNHNRLLTLGETIWLYGPGGVGKTWAALGLARAAAATPGVHVLYLAYERRGGTHNRWTHFNPDGRNAIVYPAPIARRWEIAHAHAFLDAAEHGSLIIHDAAYLMGFDSSGDNQTAGFDALRLWHPPGAADRTTIVIDHQPRKKDKDRTAGPLGSATKTAYSDAQYATTNTAQGARVDAVHLQLTKSNDGHNPEQITIDLDGNAPRAHVETRSLEEQAVAAYRTGALNKTEAAEAAGISRRSFGRRLDDDEPKPLFHDPPHPDEDPHDEEF